MSEQSAKLPQSTGVPAATAIVGRQEGLAFASLIGLLRSRSDIQIIGEFPTLRHAALARLGRELAADLVVVLQSYSDEYAQHEVNDLIGLMLHRHVLCCCGPWCISDDRTHAIWPIANRIPAATAETVIAMELGEFGRGEPPLSAMAAGEEVFAHRTRLLPDAGSIPNATTSVLVVSDDFILRDTTAQICRRLGRSVLCVGPESCAIDDAVRGLSASLRIVLIDLDSTLPSHVIMSAIIDAFRSANHACADRFVRGANNDKVAVIGMTVFAEAPVNADTLDAVIDKTELMSQLRWLLSVR